ncbi:hypothetical protein BGX26_009290 [Mortierella sp. AD094]|nr:hypothetical protein BGX26_009290 [Mortierella sp. AD094]
MGESGGIYLINAASTQSTELNLAQGRISGRLSTQQEVHANVQEVGEVSLKIDANDKRVLSTSDKLQALDLNVSTDGPIYMRLFSPTPYRGRFNLENNSTSPPYLYCSRDDQYVLLTTSDEHRLAGYTAETENGEEPTTLLPNIELISRGFGGVSLELIG